MTVNSHTTYSYVCDRCQCMEVGDDDGVTLPDDWRRLFWPLAAEATGAAEEGRTSNHICGLCVDQFFIWWDEIRRAAEVAADAIV